MMTSDRAEPEWEAKSRLGMERMSEIDRDRIAKDFDAAVNMAPAEIEAWLDTDESHKVGYKRGGEGESVGHASGRRIVAILRKRKAELEDANATLVS